MAPRLEERNPLRSVEVARELLDLPGRRTLDVGCGDGGFTNLLAAAGANVVGIDPEEHLLVPAAAGPASYIAARGEALPFADRSVEIVIFSNSLHHMAEIPQALTEAARVLEPAGLLYVMEPVAIGAYFEAVRVIEDEHEVRASAYDEVKKLRSRGFEELTETMYQTMRLFESFEAFRQAQLQRGEKRRAAFEERQEEIYSSFVAHATRASGGFAFAPLYRVNLLRKTLRQGVRQDLV